MPLSLNGNELPLAPPTFIQPWQQLSSDRGMAAGQQTAVKACTDPEQTELQCCYNTVILDCYKLELHILRDMYLYISRL